MIEHVTLTESTYQSAPYRFEAGTPNIAGTVGLGAAINYINQIDVSALVSAEHGLVEKAISGLKQIQGFKLIGQPAQRSAVVSFLLEGSHPNDVGTLLDQQGIAVRSGHHCNMPLMTRLNIPGTVRASFSLYNDEEDVERLIAGVSKASTFL
jgi:cysteine desulfurase/selenocysteine lyase